MLATVLMGAQCSPDAAVPAGSELSTINFSLPEGDYDTARIELKRHGDSIDNDTCSTDDTSTKSVSTRSLEVNKQVKNGCDYLLVLTLGKRQQSQFVPIFSNKFRDHPGEIFYRRDLTGGTVERHIVVYRLNGPQQGEALNPTPNETDLNIKVTFGNKPADQGPEEQPQRPDPSPPQSQPDSGREAGPQSNPEPDEPRQQGNPAPGSSSSQPSGSGFPNQMVADFLKARCFECHAGDRSTYNLSSYPFPAGNGQGQSVIIGKMIDAISGEDPLMPPGPRDKATNEEIEALKAWKESL